MHAAPLLHRIVNRERPRRRRRFDDRDCGEVELSRNSVLPWVISERRSLHFDDLGRGYGVVREFPTSVLARRQISTGKSVGLVDESCIPIHLLQLHPQVEV